MDTSYVAGIGLVCITIGFVIGTKLSKNLINRLISEKQELSRLGQNLVKSLTNCRERSLERYEEIGFLRERIDGYKKTEKELRQELYAYKKKYGELNNN